MSLFVELGVAEDCAEQNSDGEWILVPCPPPPPLGEYDMPQSPNAVTRVLILEVEGEGDYGPLDINLKLEGTALNGVDYVDHLNDNQPLPEVFSIPAHDGFGISTNYWGITVVDDEWVEGDETIIVTLLEGEGYEVTSGNQFQATEVIVDNDEPPVNFMINAGLNDSWYNPEIDDQGFTITVYEAEEIVLVSWFTYELVSREDTSQEESTLGSVKQRWFSAQGGYSGNQAALDVYTLYEGGFGKKQAVRRKNGTMILKFDDCYNGTVTYAVQTTDNTLVSGTSPIQRISNSNAVYCEQLEQQ